MLKTVGNPSTRYGDQTIFNGNLVIGTAGKGIDFSADSHVAGMTSELLDDYEEGTWLPILGGSISESGQIYQRQEGRYTKVGRLVTVSWDVIIFDVGTMSGEARLKQLPFSAASGSQGFRSGLALGEFNTLASNVAIFSGFVVDGTNSLYMRTAAAAADSVAPINATSLWKNFSQFIGTVTYMTT